MLNILPSDRDTTTCTQDFLVIPYDQITIDEVESQLPTNEFLKFFITAGCAPRLKEHMSANEHELGFVHGYEKGAKLLLDITYSGIDIYQKALTPYEKNTGIDRLKLLGKRAVRWILTKDEDEKIYMWNKALNIWDKHYRATIQDYLEYGSLPKDPFIDCVLDSAHETLEIYTEDVD
jgi:hypothetical protein